jgi:hypothetical protein
MILIIKDIKNKKLNPCFTINTLARNEGDKDYTKSENSPISNK